MHKVKVTLTSDVGDYNVSIIGDYETRLEYVAIKRISNPLTSIFFPLKNKKGYVPFAFEYELRDHIMYISQIISDIDPEKTQLMCRIPLLMLDKVSDAFTQHMKEIPEAFDAVCLIDFRSVCKSISLGMRYGNKSSNPSPRRYQHEQHLYSWIIGTDSEQPELDTLVAELSEMIKKSLQGEYEHILYERNRKTLRESYVRKDTDEKVFLFYCKRRDYAMAIAVSESGDIMYEGGAHDYERSMKEMEDMLAERFWELNPVRVQKGDPRLIEALKKTNSEAYIYDAMP